MQWQKPMAETCFCRTGLNRGLNHLWQKLANPADCKRTNQKTGLKFWATNANKCPLLAPRCPGPAVSVSEAYMGCVFSVCGQLTAGKRNQLTTSLEERILKLLVNISGSCDFELTFTQLCKFYALTN